MVTQIVKVPGINGLGKTNGCERAGNAILKVLKEEVYSDERGNEVEFSRLDIEEIHLDNSNLEITNNLIYKNSFEFYGLKDKLIFLGGDHSISYSLVKAFKDFCSLEKKEPCLIIFDAHPDCMPTDNRKEYPTHEEWLRGVIESGFPSSNILLVGSRNPYKEEVDFLKEKGIKQMGMNAFLEDFEGACDSLTEFANKRPLYVSFDIDVVDPAFCPSVSYPEPGGFTSREIIYIFQRINKIKSLKAIDIVEINEKKDREVNGQTIKIGAKILGEVLR